MDHPLNSRDTADDLWDELSHQHSREIQQHQIKHATSGRNNIISTASSAAATLQQAWQETTNKVKSTATSLAQHAASYRPVPQQQQQPPKRHLYQPPTATTSNNLAEFGLQSHNDEPLLEEEGNVHVSGGYAAASPTEDGDYREEPYVFLRPFRLLPQRDGWGAVANLDLFFVSLYNYYYHRGLMPILGKGVVELVSLVMTLWLSVFLFAYVDWHSLAQCHDEESCHSHFSSYLIPRPFSTLSLWNLLTLLYCILFLCYTAFSVWSLLHTMRDAFQAKAFFEETLGIPSHKLEGGAVDWDRDVVQRIVELQRTGQHRVAIHGQDLDALVVAQRILRKENFMVAFFNRRMLDLSVPLPFMSGVFFSKSLEWSLYFCILNYMFNHKYQVRPAFYLDPTSLKRRFMLCGIAHAVFMPFLLFFMMLHFSMQNVYDMKSSKEYLGPREWSLVAKWTFREFNELPHIFERRMAPSYDAAGKYLELFTQSAIVTALGRLLVFIGGSLGAVLIAFAALNDAILLHVKIGDWNLLWFVGVLGVVYSVGKSLQPSAKLQSISTRNLFGEREDALAQVGTHTHHHPEVWKARPWDETTRKAVSALFRYKAQLFGLELLSIVLAPIILCYSLPGCAEHICEFVMSIKSEVPGAGEVCGYATFNFDIFGDETWEGKTMGARPAESLAGSVSASVMQTMNVEAGTSLHPKPKAMHGKMEKSFFNFKTAHPSWRSTDSGQTLVDRIEDYKNNEMMALSKERQHHIEAVARQLETLAELEQRRQRDENHGKVHMNESYIGKAAGGADSGGGGIRHFDVASIPEQVTPPRVHFESPSIDDTQAHQHFSQSSQASGRHLSGIGPHGPHANPATLSVLHYADVGLSTELRRILNRSSLDSDGSMIGSVLGGMYDPTLSGVTGAMSHIGDRTQVAGRQYQWLERYHAHVAAQRRQRLDENSGTLQPDVLDTQTADDRQADSPNSIV